MPSLVEIGPVVFQLQCLRLHLGEKFSRDGIQTDEQNPNKKVLTNSLFSVLEIF